uniref:Uncharacterized protein n=1 Tax=Triticum urartu TaxID=4572 RepID=A0A8R7PUI3_TRIUA
MAARRSTPNQQLLQAVALVFLDLHRLLPVPFVRTAAVTPRPASLCSSRAQAPSLLPLASSEPRPHHCLYSCPSARRAVSCLLIHAPPAASPPTAQATAAAMDW